MRMFQFIHGQKCNQCQFSDLFSFWGLRWIKSSVFRGSWRNRNHDSGFRDQSATLSIVGGATETHTHHPQVHPEVFQFSNGKMEKWRRCYRESWLSP